MRLVSAGPLFFFVFLCLWAGAIPGCAAAPDQAPVRLHPAVTVERGSRELRVGARVSCTRGFLEQVACGKGSREHESLLVIDAPASVVHAGLLAIGLRPGVPGSWKEASGGTVELHAPTGPEVQVLVVVPGGAAPVPVADWLRDERGSEAAAPRFVFAGSRLVPGSAGDRYLADESGSVVGLVTFGDETVALCEVLPDRVGVEPAHFTARTASMPPEGTPVTLVFRAVP